MPRLTGKVKNYNDSKGFGFIISDVDGELLFAHHSEIQGKTLPEGINVEFDVHTGPKGKQASNIRII